MQVRILCLQSLGRNVGSNVRHAGFQFIQIAWFPVAGIVSGKHGCHSAFQTVRFSSNREGTFPYIHLFSETST
jgi:hypothetical protein